MLFKILPIPMMPFLLEEQHLASLNSRIRTNEVVQKLRSFIRISKPRSLDVAVFAFPDVSCLCLGDYRLLFTMYAMNTQYARAVRIADTVSQPFNGQYRGSQSNIALNSISIFQKGLSRSSSVSELGLVTTTTPGRRW